jgi:hypothetical protein
VRVAELTGLFNIGDVHLFYRNDGDFRTQIMYENSTVPPYKGCTWELLLSYFYPLRKSYRQHHARTTVLLVVGFTIRYRSMVLSDVVSYETFASSLAHLAVGNLPVTKRSGTLKYLDIRLA